MLYIIPPLRKGRLGGDGQPPRISRISTDNLSFKIRYVKILVIRWRDSAANKKPLLPGEQFDAPCQKIQLKKIFAKKSAHLHKLCNTLLYSVFTGVQIMCRGVHFFIYDLGIIRNDIDATQF